ncbi:MAG: 30S ribosomal protein S11 [Candidatus Saccharibacteria bacterium]|nr:30S ribosomal protein S11 [Candidatus Saccharibacteria bacterium]
MAEDNTTTTTPESKEDVKAKPTTRRKKNKRPVPYGHFHVLATFNNTIVTFTDKNGGVLVRSSAGSCGFRGSKKGTAYAAQIAAEKAADQVKQLHGTTKVDVFVKGIGLGRDAAVRSLGPAGIAVESITDVTGVPHGGVRPKKARRV